jgi:hypothetical protein
MALEDQIVKDAPEGTFFSTGGTLGIGRDTLTAYGIGDAITVAAWVRVTTIPSEGNTADIVRVTPVDPTENQIGLQILTSGGQGFFQWQVSDSTGVTTTTQTGTTAVVVDRWYLVMGCKNDSFTMRLFINGVDDATILVAGIAPTIDASRKISIGYDVRGINDNFDGNIASVMMWNLAISEESVKAVYNGGWLDLDLRVDHPCYGEASSLRHWWRLGQGSTDESVGDNIVSDWGPVSWRVALPDFLGSVDQESTMLPGVSPVGTSAVFETGDVLSTPVALPVGISDEFSISLWVNPVEVVTSLQTMLYIGPASPSVANVITLQIAGTIADDPFRVEVKDSVGSTIQLVDYDNLLVAGEWQHVLVTFDNALFAPVTVYKNGIEIVGVSAASGGNNHLDSSRFIEVGGNIQGVGGDTAYEGQIGHIGIWSSVLNGDEAKTLFSEGYCLDLRYNGASYQSAEFLRHYFKFGEDLFTKGRDFMDTQTGALVNPLTTETGTVEITGDAPSNI